MDELFKALRKEYDIIILSAGYDDMIKLFLAKHGLLNLVHEVFATPTSITSKIHFFKLSAITSCRKIIVPLFSTSKL